MKRYHFDIGGGDGALGLAGALFANDDSEALDVLQSVLDKTVNDATIDDLDGGSEPEPADVKEARLSYVDVCTNGMRATMEMFDEIEGDEDGIDIDALRKDVIESMYATKSEGMKDGSDDVRAIVEADVAAMNDEDVVTYAREAGLIEGSAGEGA